MVNGKDILELTGRMLITITLTGILNELFVEQGKIKYFYIILFLFFLTFWSFNSLSKE